MRVKIKNFKMRLVKKRLILRIDFLVSVEADRIPRVACLKGLSGLKAAPSKVKQIIVCFTLKSHCLCGF